MIKIVGIQFFDGLMDRSSFKYGV